MIYRLQLHNFKWEDEPLETLLKKYCKWNPDKRDYVGCKGALMWWCNANKSSQFCINHNKYLKEFMINNHPNFKISSKCCNYAKKKVVHNLIYDGNYDLNIYGVRKAEGGIRSTSYKNCFDENIGECDDYRPLFWYLDADKKDYETAYDIEHSKCYTEYGLIRTGCAGCPYGRNFENELEIIQKYEPKLYKAVNNIFHDSYEYTRKYRDFIRTMKEKEKLEKCDN